LVSTFKRGDQDIEGLWEKEDAWVEFDKSQEKQRLIILGVPLHRD